MGDDVDRGRRRLKLDVQLSNSVIDAVDRARVLEEMGVDGAFSFENAHDLFLPLAAAAPVCSLDLYTNVAIAFPRSPMHLAQTAYDLHQLSGGRFSLGLCLGGAGRPCSALLTRSRGFAGLGSLGRRPGMSVCA